MTFSRAVTVALLISLACMVPVLGSATVSEDDLSNKLESVAADWNIPGMAVAVVKDGHLVFVRGFGIRRVGSTLPVTAHTRFSIGSCTKSFTAAVLGALVDQQSISWDDPVVRRLQGFEMPNADDSGRVTVRDLLAHRTGLVGGDLISWGSSFSRREVVDRIRFLLPIAPLRSAFHYNNNTYGAAGEVAQVTSGRTWEELVIAGFLEPLLMSSTTTSISAIPAEADRASPHAMIAGQLQPIQPINEDNIAAAGALWSTATDMARWMLMLLDEGEFAGRRYLAKTTLKEMWELQTPMPLEDEWNMWPDSARPHFSGYGLGWFLHDSRGRKIVSHEGMSDGMVAGVALIPEEELGIVILANRHESNVVRPATLILLDHFTGLHEDTDWNQIYLDLEGDESVPGEDLPAISPSPVRPARDLTRYAGTYHNPAIGNASVTIVADRLRVDFSHTPLYSGNLEHLDADRFLVLRDYPLVDPSPIIFRVNDHTGLATGFIVKPDATEWLASIEYQFEMVVDQAP